MPDRRAVVVNTGPILALIAGTGDLEVMRLVYDRVIVPLEVLEELEATEQRAFGRDVLASSLWLVRRDRFASIPPLLRQSLDRGEAAVIQAAMEEGVSRVCIDETAGRRIARLSGLTVTGSLGVLLRALAEGHSMDIEGAIARMRDRGIWLSDRVVAECLRLVAEIRAGRAL